MDKLYKMIFTAITPIVTILFTFTVINFVLVFILFLDDIMNEKDFCLDLDSKY